MIVYEFDVIEQAGRLAAVVVFIMMALVLSALYKHRIFYILSVIGVCATMWISFYSGGAYYFKAGLNAFWLFGVIFIWRYCFLPWRSS